jgi:hypothetical protein
MVLYQWNLFSTPFSDKPADLERQRYIPSQRTSRTEDIIYGKSTMKTGLERFPRRTLLHIFLKVGWPPKKKQGKLDQQFCMWFSMVLPKYSQTCVSIISVPFEKKWVSTPKFPTVRSFVPSPSRAIALRRPRDISPRQRGGWPLLDFIGIVMGYSLNSTYPITMVNIWLLYG